MDQKQFELLYTGHAGSSRVFPREDWDKALADWEKYYELIVSEDGLPIEKWLKNPDGYLPDFLDTKEKKFGHARIGNYKHVMIYQYTGSDSNRKDKYIDVYKNKGALDVYDNVSDVQADYEKNIKTLLKKIVGARNLAEVYAAENSDEYRTFSCKTILQKITILMSLRADSPYQNEFMWIFDESAMINLSKIFECELDSSITFLENNKKIYDIAKRYAGLTSMSSSDDLTRLYDFLWYLSDSNYNTSELSDFTNANIIFNGAPGTGKTYGVTKGIEKLKNTDSLHYKDMKYVQFHPAFTYQDFIEGIKPMGIVNGNLNLQIVNGVFKEFCICVRKENEAFYASLHKKPDPKKPSEFKEWPHYYFVADEINRGNLSSILGETFSLFDFGYRDYDFSGNYSSKNNLVTTALSNVINASGNDNLVYKKVGNEVCFGIPFNIHFIGIMNDVDKSIDTFDLALRRRFKWIQKYCDYSVITNELENDGYDTASISEYVDSCKELNKLICVPDYEGLRLGRMYEIGHAFFLKIRHTGGNKRVTRAKKEEVFESYISGTLKEYIRQVAEENEIDSWINKARTAFGL